MVPMGKCVFPLFRIARQRWMCTPLRPFCLAPPDEERRAAAGPPVSQQKARQMTRLMLEGEVETAIELFEDLKRTGTLSLRACNTILAIQPTAETAATMAAMADTVLEDMVAEGLVPTEPTFSNSIRLHMRVGNVERAEQLVQVVMESDEMILRLRTCSPLLLWYIQRNDIDKAVKLCEAMMLQGVVATENELVPLLCALYAAGQVRKRTNKVLNWMSEALMTVSPEKLEEMRSIPSAEFKTTEQLLEAGEIELLGLSNSQTEFIRDAVRAHAAKTGAGPALEGFGKWLRRNPPFDYVIDCGNVAWHGQARFCAEQVEAMRRELVGRGARVLLVLSSHSRHQIRQSTSGKKLIREWQPKDPDSPSHMCITPLQKADDLFWMYTTVAKGSRAMAISNDLLRDHHVEMKIPLRLHERWKQSKIHNFDVTGVVPTKESPRSAPEVTIMPSAAYSREIQASDTTWSIPASTGELWLTLPKRPQG